MYNRKKISSLFSLSISIIIMFLLTLIFTKLKHITKVAASDFVALLIRTIAEREGLNMFEQVGAGLIRLE